MNNTMPPQKWLGRPYYALDAYLKNTYGHKCYKIALDAHMTCPNRDGTLDTRGCIFCSAGGSGEFAASGSDMQAQLEAGLALFGHKQVGQHYIAYFQAYTNTYAPCTDSAPCISRRWNIPWSAASPSPPGRTVCPNLS